MGGLLVGLLVFLVGALVLCVVIYVVHLVMSMLPLPPQIRTIALLILGLICFIVLLMLAIHAATGGGGLGITL